MTNSENEPYRSVAQRKAYAAGRVAVKRKRRLWAQGYNVVLPGVSEALEYARDNYGHGARAFLRGVQSMTD